jgi:hypothetical protein
VPPPFKPGRGWAANPSPPPPTPPEWGSHPTFGGAAPLPARGDGSAGCQPSFHGSGAGQLSLPGASHRPLESRRRSFSPTGFTRTPLVAKSLRSWKENPAPSIARPRPTNTFPAISPRKPSLLSKQEDVGLRGLHSDCFSRGRRSNQTPLRPLSRTGRPIRWGTSLLSQADASQAKGRFNRTSAKRSEIRCTRGAFHR